MRRMDERSPSFWSEDKSGTKRAHRSPTGETPTAKRQAIADNHSGKSAARKSLFQNESSALNSTRDFKSPSGHIVPQPNYKSFSCFGTWEMGFLLTVKQKMQRGCFFGSTSRSCM
ncbi:uncharacterized protein [Littorina saxatilis]|uniref:uncharacterized protein n=1 Tax=Littorina saxatilis TaxID=31220 RepID=UPI0038B57F96